MAKVVLMDVETRSRVDLPRLGGRRYALDCELLCGGWMVAGSDLLRLWAPCWSGEPTPRLLESIRPEHPLVTPELRITLDTGPEAPGWLEELARNAWAAHNADGFDARVWEQTSLPQPSRWIDTAHACRAVGLPAGLDAAGEAVAGVKKDPGASTMLALCKPQTKGRMKGRYLPVNASNLAALLRYQVADVLLLGAVFGDITRRWRATMTPEESEVLEVSRVVDDRGVRFDADLAARVCDVEDAMRDVVARELHEELRAALELEGPEDVRALLRSPQKVAGVVSEVWGVTLPNTQRGTLEALISAGELEGTAARFAQARIDAVRVTSAKLARAAEQLINGRIAGTLRYYGAHTGRWTSQRVQLHNLPRGVSRPGVEALEAALEGGAEALAKLCAAHEVRVSDALASLVRACFVGDPWLVVADLSNIEARVLPWLAGDAEGLDVFRGGGDPYIAFARRLWPDPWPIDTAPDDPAAQKDAKTRRAVGKVGVLASGYGAGAARIGAFAAGYGVDLADAGLTPADLCEGWRDANPIIAGDRTGREYKGVACRSGGFWKRLERAFKAIAEGAPEERVGEHLRIVRAGEDAHCYLPSGRALVYHRLRIEDRPSFGEIKPGLCYTQRRGRSAYTVDLYGGKLAENVTQAAARDFFSWGLVQLERRGLRPVLHVHDEVICETDDVEGVLDAMTTRPGWAPDFPLGAEGFVTRRYAKAPPAGMSEVKREAG